jgi:multicomponent K+:H+ antiporter subunit D
MSAALFLIAGLVQEQRGQAQDRFVRSRPVNQPALLGGLFFIAALALVGMPPLSGFVGKILLLQAANDNSDAAWIWPPILISGLAALIIFSRAGTTLFWRAQGVSQNQVVAHPLQITAIILLLLTSPAMVIWGGALTDLSLSAAYELHQQPLPVIPANMAVPEVLP